MELDITEYYREYMNSWMKEYYTKNSEIIKARAKKYRENNPNRVKETETKRHFKHKEERNAYSNEHNKEYYEKNKTALLLKKKEYYKKNKENILKKMKEKRSLEKNIEYKEIRN